MGAQVMDIPTVVIPAKAGIQSRDVTALSFRSDVWIPTVAGMTECDCD